MPLLVYLPSYAQSHALVIGIDKYVYCSPLNCARNDAQAVAKILIERFGFLESNVVSLLDSNATAEAIRSSFLKFATDPTVGPNDRILVFFAGHGHTFTSGRRGETGFLVPVDGKADDLSTLIRWDELTRNADLITAKRVLFLMDACYGGLALSRQSLPTGSMRFLKDMHQRYARQVLTSGKADEVVADSGGVRAGHSIFTAHLLDALDGAAATPAGILTANRVMAFVYEKVANDQHSHQTPHFGFIDGDGDFVFDSGPEKDLKDLTGSDEQVLVSDVLVKVATAMAPANDNAETISDVAKRLIGDPTSQIKLDDFITAHLREAIQKIDPQKFPFNGPFTNDDFVDRLKRYEEAIADLETIVILLARWGKLDQISLLEKIFLRLSEVDKGTGGTVVWLKMAWYPVHLLMYAAGIAAVSSENFSILRAVFLTRVRDKNRYESQPLIVPVTDAMAELSDVFKRIPGHERQYTPRSEYVFKLMQPPLEDALFLGESYETTFDVFEVLWALVYADLRSEAEQDVWGPPGRFAWKQSRGRGAPLSELLLDAERQKKDWRPLQAGLFGGSFDRFSKTATSYRDLIMRYPLR